MRKFIYIFTLILLFVGVCIQSWADINDGLVAYYPFNGDANDESGNNNHGIVYGATLTADRFGIIDSAYLFDGMNDYIFIQDHSSLHLNKYSICSWAYPNQISGKYGRITEKSASNSYWLYIWNDARIVTGFYSGGYRNLWSKNTVGLYTFTFICGTYDGNTLKIYINGQLDNNIPANGTPNQNGQPLIIGAKYSGLPVDYFKGILDDMRIYNRALSNAEIQIIYSLIDNDRDGFSGNYDDCDDNDPTINPAATELCDNIDNNCNGYIDEEFDVDEDGYTVCEGDCNDDDKDVHPGMIEIPYNCTDNDCNASTPYDDLDNDGYGIASDCNDSDSNIYPEASDLKHDGLDQDCNGYDLSIDIVKATYKSNKDELKVEAVSAIKNLANLNLVGYGSMEYKRSKWSITVNNVGGDPVIVTVCGTEGCDSINTAVK